MAEPPSVEGAFQDTVSEPGPDITEWMEGAPGTSASGVVPLDGML